MIRLTWLQARTQTVVAASGLVIAAAILAVTGPHLVSLYNDTVANCKAHNDCDTAKDLFLRHDRMLWSWLRVLVVVIPGLFGIFWGAPLVARELESGTHRLAWTQSVTRTRWLAVKVGVVGLAGAALAGLFSLIVTWWSSPLDRTHMARFSTFDQRDLVPIGYAAFAFIVGVAAGIVVRRTLPAMAGALVAFVGARLAVAHWLRPHLLAASHRDLPLSAAHHLGFVDTSSGPVFTAGEPNIDNGWILSSRLVDKAGHTATARSIDHVVHTACPLIDARVSHSAGPARPPDPRIFGECVNRIAAKFHLGVTYQPSSHYWPLQWYEMTIFIVASLVVTAFCFWWVRRRHV